MQKFIEDIEKAITNTPCILSSNIQKQFGTDNKTVNTKSNEVINTTMPSIDDVLNEISAFIIGK